jgi:hypothetical protein
VLRLVAARAEWNDADARAHFFGRSIAGGKECREARLEDLHVAAQQARLEALEKVLHGEQRLRLRGAEPEAWQLVLRRRRIRFHEAITARIPVPFDRRVVAALHVLEVALERRERHFELVHEFARRDGAALANEMVDLVEAFGAVHGEHALDGEGMIAHAMS